MINISSSLIKAGSAVDEEAKADEPVATPVKESGGIKAVDELFELGQGFEAFKAGISSSPIGMWYRKAEQGTFNPFIDYELTPEQMDKAFQDTNGDLDTIKIARSGAENYEEFLKNLDLIYENRANERKLANSPWYTSFAGYAGQMIGNPVDIFTTALAIAQPEFGVPLKVATGASRGAVILSKAGKFVAPVASNVVSGVGANQLQEITTGIDHDVWTDVYGITAVTLGIKGVKFTGDTARKVAINHDKMIKGEAVDTSTVLGGVSSKTLPIYKKINDVREQLMSGLPDAEVKSRVLRYMHENDNPLLKAISSKLTGFEQGIRSLGNKNFATKGNETLMEVLKGYHVTDQRLNNLAANKMSAVGDYFGRDKVNSFLYAKLEGRDTRAFGKEMNSNKELEELAQIFSNHYEKRGNELVNHNLIENLYNMGKYVPLVIDHKKVVDFVGRLNNKGLSTEAVRARIATNLYNGVLDDRATYNKFYQIFKEEQAQKLAEEQAKAKARGVTLEAPPEPTTNTTKAKAAQKDQDEFLSWLSDKADKHTFGYTDQNSSLSESFDRNTGRVNFQKRRMPWNSAYRDAEGFALNDLRMDLMDATRSYFATTSGLLSTKRVYNTDYEGMKKMIHDAAVYRKDKGNLDPKLQEDVERDLGAIINRVYGKAISDRAYDNSEAISLIARNLTYGAYSTLMGMLSYGEVAQALQAYSMKFMMQALPGLREIYEKFLTKDLKKADRKYIQDYLVGNEVCDLLSVREIIRSNREMFSNANPYLAKAVGISQVLAEYSPGNMLMRYSNNSIIDAVQSCFWSELINKAHSKDTKYRGFLRDIDLKRVDLKDKDYQYVLDKLKEHTVTGKNGMSIKDTFKDLADDDKFSFAFRRLTNYVCDETIQRRGLDDIFIWQIGKNSPFLSLAMQFKTFAIQSYNKRLVKMMNRLEDEGGLAQANNFMINSALTAAITMAQFNIRSLGMPDDVREKYLKDNLGISSIEDLSDPENYKKLMFNAIFNRNPLFASIALLANAVGIGTTAKTTASTRAYGAEEEGLFESALNPVTPLNLGDTIIDMSPAFRLSQSIVNGGLGTYNLIRDSILDEDTYKERKMTSKMIMNGISGTFNLPIIAPYIKSYSKEKLDDYKYGL